MAEPGQLLAACPACKTTILQLTAHTIPTARTWGESQSYQHGQHSSLPTTHFRPGPPHRRFATASMKGGARASNAGIATHATDTMVC